MRILCTLTVLAVFAAPALGAIQSKSVSYRQGQTELRGVLCYDDQSSAKRPAVLVVHEWWGLNDYAKSRAKQLAEMGYVAFAIDMYGEGKQTEHPQTAGEWAAAVSDELRLDRFQAALDFIQSQAQVDASRVAAIGYCFGGGSVLRLAAAGVDLKAVVSFHGSLPTAEIAPGTVKAKVLVCHGAADPFTEAGQVEKFQQTFSAAGADWELISFGNAKHSFTVPNAASRGMEALEYNAAADKRSWAAMKSFLEEAFGG
jgi:dienelactone hydrolase